MLYAVMDWSAIGVGGAFVVGMIFGGVIVLRMLDYLRRERQGDKGNDKDV